MLYTPDNSQDSQQFGINPFQRVVIDLVNTPGIQSANGAQFPQLEGNSIYVERCGWPVFMSIIDRVTGKELSFTLRPGAEFCLPFKGLTLRFDTTFTAYAELLTLIVGKGNVAYRNQLNEGAINQTNLPQRIITATAVTTNLAWPIPPGMRFIKRFHFGQAMTTITDAAILFLDAGGNTITAPPYTQPQVGAVVPANYTPSPNQRRFLDLHAGTIAGRAVANEDNIAVPSGAAEMQLILNGTGLGAYVYDFAFQ